MKRFFSSILLLTLLCMSPMANAQSARDILGGLLGGSSSSSSSDSTSSSSSSSGLGDLLGGVANALGLGKSDLSVANLEGTWKYSAPAVSFKSDNLLMKAGGAAAATTIENKLEPYYKTAGLTNVTMTFAADSTFTMSVSKASVSGTIEITGSDEITFHFTALGKLNIGSLEAYASLSSSTLEITFDVSKLVTILEKVGSVTNNSSIKGITSLLSNYDGIMAGFELKKS